MPGSYFWVPNPDDTSISAQPFAILLHDFGRLPALRIDSVTTSSELLEILCLPQEFGHRLLGTVDLVHGLVNQGRNRRV